MPAEPQYRPMNAGTLTSADTMGHKSVLSNQRMTIEKLRGQNESLKHDLLLENKFSVRPGDSYAQSLINNLQDEGDNLARKIVLEMRKSKMLDQQLSEAGNILTSTRTLMGGINTAKEQSVSVQKRIKLLENRLEKAYVKYNQSITHNKQLREQINNLRRERIMFESIHSNLECEVARLKREMAEIIQLANQVFEAKEKAIQEMSVLMAQAEKEQAGFEEEWRQLTQIIEDDKRERERARAQELAVRERETQELLKGGVAGAKARAGRNKAGHTILGGPAYNKAMAQNVAAEKVQMYGQAFEKIQQATSITDIDQLVSSFISAEDQNYTLFNYVNEVNTEIEKLEDQITVIRSEMTRYADGGRETDLTKSTALREVEDRLAGSESQAELYEKRSEAASGTVSQLKTAIWDLFNRIGCNTPSVRALLGNEGTVTESNLLAYLGIIEQRTNELLQAFAVQRAGDTSAANSYLPGPGVIAEALVAQPLTTVGPRIIIEPPSSMGPSPEEIEMLAAEQAASAGEDAQHAAGPGDSFLLGGGTEDEKPLTREALEARVAKTLPRKIETAIRQVKPGEGKSSAPAGRR